MSLPAAFSMRRAQLISAVRLEHPRWLIGLIAALSAMSLVSFLRWVGHPFPQFIHLRGSGDRELSIVWAGTPYWWSGIAEAGLRAADELIAVEGAPVDANLFNRFRTLAAQGYTSLSVTALREGTEWIHTRVPLRPLTLAQAIEFRFPNDLLAWTLLALAWAIYRSRPNHALNRAASRCAAVIAGVFGVFFSELDFASMALHARLLDVGWVILSSATPAVIFDLGMYFTGDADRWPHFPSARRWVWRLSVVVGLAYAVRKVLGWWLGWTHWLAVWELILFRGTTVLLALLVLGMVMRLGWLALRRNQRRRLRVQAGIVLAGILALAPVLALHARGSMTNQIDLFQEGLDLRYFYLIVPLAFGVAIMRYQLFGAESNWLLLVALVTASGILADIGAWWMRQLGMFTDSSPFIPPSLALFGLVFASMVAGVGLVRLGRRLLERQRIAYAGMYRLHEMLANTPPTSELPKLMVQAIRDALELEAAGLWLLDPADNAKLRLAALATSNEATRWPREQPSDWLYGMNTTRCYPVSEAPPAWHLPGAWMIASLAVQQQPLGVLVMSNRWDEEMLSRHDLEMGALVAQRCALALLTARQFEAMRAVPQQIALAQEQERERLARELHDTVQQVLGRVPIYLGIARHHLAKGALAQADAQIQAAIGDLSESARMVRQIRLELSAIQLNTSLETPLRELSQRFAQRTGIKTELSLPEDIDAQLGATTRYAVFRIVQQALDNIEMHSDARRAWITLETQGQRLVLAVRDDGRGFSPADQQRAAANGHIGLRSMEAHAQAAGGDLEVRSAPGAGVQVVAHLPLSQPTKGRA